jgi:hypothetical protein
MKHRQCLSRKKETYKIPAVQIIFDVFHSFALKRETVLYGDRYFESSLAVYLCKR